jgi:long-chain acyl-CoA synthetase
MTLVDRVHLAGDPQEVVLWSGPAAITREELLARTLQIAEQLREAGIACVALYADNSPDWILVDLACQHAGMRLVPVPLFFPTNRFNMRWGSVAQMR